MHDRIKFVNCFTIGKQTRGDFRKELGQDELDNMWCHQILFDTRSEISCDERDSTRKI